MTSTITAPRHAQHRAEPTPWTWDAVTAPIPVQVPLRQERPSTPPASSVRWVGAGVLAAAMLLGTGLGAYALGHRDADPAPVAATAAPAVAPSAVALPTTSTSTAVRGPQLTDTAGRPVEDAVAGQVRAVYVALQQNDIEALERAEGAAGSDDGLTSFPHLTSATTRDKLLAALRTRPVHHANSYRYRAGGYALEFQQADGSLGAGLGSISGPWNATATTSSSRTTTSAPDTSVFPYGNGATGRYGDGCGPYEHNLNGYCSPDTDVLDENGRPDPSRAVVPGNLKNPSHGD